MKKRFKKNFHKKGVTLIIAVLTIVILGTILGGMASIGRLTILGGEALVITDDVFYIAETGIESGINYLINQDDLNWYNNADTSDGTLLPNFTEAKGNSLTLGGDTKIEISVNYPATVLSSFITAGTFSIPVFSAYTFYEYGQIAPSEKFYINIGNDIIQISLFSTSSYPHTLSCLGSDDLNIGVYDDDHSQTEKVYPITVVSQDIGTTESTIPVVNTRGFLNAGTIILTDFASPLKEQEYIRYKSKTKTSFIGCERASNGTTAIDPLANNKFTIIPINYEATITSKATTKGISKSLDVCVQYRDF